jgi:hypothetical protein
MTDIDSDLREALAGIRRDWERASWRSIQTQSIEDLRAEDNLYDVYISAETVAMTRRRCPELLLMLTRWRNASARGEQDEARRMFLAMGEHIEACGICGR